MLVLTVNEPRRIGFATCCHAIPGLAVQFVRRVPERYVTILDDLATVRCPCGHCPDVSYAIPTACECDRWFLFDGRGVRVASYPALT